MFFLIELLFVPFSHALYHDHRGWEKFRDGSDLQHFVTRPELKAPRYLVTKHVAEAITPGYLLVSSYTHIGPAPTTKDKDFAPCMNGPHIYDEEGELIWSGACLYDNRNVFNFRPVVVNGSQYFTFFLSQDDRDAASKPLGVLLDDKYKEVARIDAEDAEVDPHELKLLPQTNTALLTTVVTIPVSMPGYGRRLVSSTGFQEIDMNSRRALFRWDPVSASVNLSESCDARGMADTVDVRAWDFFHINSVHKFNNGDYIVSARHMSAIYRVSGVDGHVVWTLGGCLAQSDFLLGEDVTFFWQHDATVVHENATHVVISLFDNQSEDLDRGEPVGERSPVGKLVVLDLTAMTASILRDFSHPENGQTALLGSILVFDNRDYAHSNVLVNWAMQGYVSEYDGSGRLVMEAKFASDRQRTYRALKTRFIGRPHESPLLKLSLVGAANNETATMFWMSWNGATEVVSWILYGQAIDADDKFEDIGTVKRHGFETSWMLPVAIKSAYAEAIDSDGRILGKTKVSSLPDSGAQEPKLRLVSAQAARMVAPRPTPELILDVLAIVGVFALVRIAAQRLARFRQKSWSSLL